MIKRSKIPTLVGIIILVAGIFTGVYFVGIRQIFRIGADSSVAPKDIRSSNQTDSSVTISWVTDKETTGFLVWGTTRNSVSRVEKESEQNEKYFTHSITLTGLEPNTTYFYKINSEGSTFDNSGLPWEFTTGATLGVSKENILISGSVLTPSGNPASRALIYANLHGYLLSTISSEEGSYVFQLGLARDVDLQSYLDVNPAATLLEISVEHQGGVSSAQIFPQSGKPVPPIILGQVYNFRDLQPSSSIGSPNVSLNLPQDAPKESKFNLPLVTGTPTPTSVILESLKEGEVITSQKPAFFGRGPGGQSVSIVVEPGTSQENFKIASNGTYTWTPSSSLEPGTHKVTMSWVDSTGITRTLTRTFIIQAGEVPAFEATPSQTLAPTPSPTTSPTAVPTATPIATIRPSATPAATPTAPAIPATGDFLPTVILSIMGMMIMSFSFLLWKQSEN